MATTDKGLDDAYVAGALKAYVTVANGGELSDAPLSGEWAGAPTIADVHAQFGEPDGDEWYTTADAWESGYQDVNDGSYGVALTERFPTADAFAQHVREFIERRRAL